MTQQQSAMRMSGIILAGIGILFALSAMPVLHPILRIFLQVAYWPVHSVPSDILVPVPLLLAISGGLTVGLGRMLWSLGTYVAPVSPVAAAKVAQYATWSWFCTDSTASVLVGAPFNAVLNLSLLVLILLSSRVKDENQTVSA